MNILVLVGTHDQFTSMNILSLIPMISLPLWTFLYWYPWSVYLYEHSFIGTPDQFTSMNIIVLVPMISLPLWTFFYCTHDQVTSMNILLSVPLISLPLWTFFYRYPWSVHLYEHSFIGTPDQFTSMIHSLMTAYDNPPLGYTLWWVPSDRRLQCLWTAVSF